MCTTMKELEKQIATYRSLKSLIDEATADFEACKTEIFNYLDTNNKTEEIGPDFKVSWSDCKKTTYDGKSLQALLGEDLVNYQKTSSYRRLNVK